LPKRDVARPAGSRLLGFSLEGRLPRPGRRGGRGAAQRHLDPAAGPACPVAPTTTSSPSS